jgi:hypothetical protein
MNEHTQRRASVKTKTTYHHQQEVLGRTDSLISFDETWTA